MPCGTAHGSRPDGQVQPLWTQQAKFRVRCVAGASPWSLSHSPKRAAARAKKGQWLGLSCGVTCGGDPNQGCSKQVYILWEHRPQRWGGRWEDCLRSDLGTHPLVLGLPWWLRQYRMCLQYGRPRFHPWVGKIPRKREPQPIPVFLPRESHGQKKD